MGGAGEAIERFIAQGLHELGDRLGPINWQFMATKKFDPEDFEAFLKLLPRETHGLPLRHALEVRHESFQDERFIDLARQHGVAIVFADSEEFPKIEEPTADFTYARLMRSQERYAKGYAPSALAKIAARRKIGRSAATLSLFHLRRQRAQSRRRAGADRNALSWPISPAGARMGKPRVRKQRIALDPADDKPGAEKKHQHH